MRSIWNSLSIKERDTFLNEKVLNLKCFETEEGRKWFDYHYNLGYYRYSTDPKATLEFINKLSLAGIEFEIKITKEFTYCRVTPTSKNNSSFDFERAKTLPEAVCLSVINLYHKELSSMLKKKI